MTTLKPLVDRRSFFRVGLGAAASVSVSGLLDSQAWAQPKSDGKNDGPALIMLWMNGGPSQLDTFDPKPGQANGGSFKAIQTAASEVRICEHLPKLARQMQHLTLVRSISSKEGSHERGRHLMHTGYLPTGTAAHPGLGSIVSAELGAAKATLPSFVSMNLPSTGPGLLGMPHAAFHVPKPEEGIPDAAPADHVNAARFQRRVGMLSSLEAGFLQGKRGPQAEEHREVYEKTLRLMHSPALAAFDLKQEKEATRAAYGKTPFGQGCLLARRLIEAGVKAVEVSLDGWDTHINNFNGTQKQLEQLDPAFARLIADLEERGRLANTVVVWMGEFGRTPKINALGGRDHWPKGWTAVVAGGGIPGGRVIGKTSPDGMEIAERPVTVPDLFASVVKRLGIDPAKENLAANGRPIAITDKGTPLAEL